jgi:hypothetical protein
MGSLLDICHKSLGRHQLTSSQWILAYLFLGMYLAYVCMYACAHVCQVHFGMFFTPTFPFSFRACSFRDVVALRDAYARLAMPACDMWRDGCLVL